MRDIVELNIKTVQPGFYDITQEVEETLKNKILHCSFPSGILTLFCMHTSCGLLINESFDETARKDLEKFFDYLAPENLSFIKHKFEGPDDSPAHMKTAMIHQSLSLIVNNQGLVLGRWQGIYLAEFRRIAHRRTVILKYQPDHTA